MGCHFVTHPLIKNLKEGEKREWRHITTFIFFIKEVGVPPLKGITTVVLFIKEVGDTKGHHHFYIVY